VNGTNALADEVRRVTEQRELATRELAQIGLLDPASVIGSHD
jgi:hypothetical protein